MVHHGAPWYIEDKASKKRWLIKQQLQKPNVHFHTGADENAIPEESHNELQDAAPLFCDVALRRQNITHSDVLSTLQ